MSKIGLNKYKQVYVAGFELLFARIDLSMRMDRYTGMVGVKVVISSAMKCRKTKGSNIFVAEFWSMNICVFTYMCEWITSEYESADILCK